VTTRLRPASTATARTPKSNGIHKNFSTSSTAHTQRVAVAHAEADSSIRIGYRKGKRTTDPSGLSDGFEDG
jgi:hypothetical protein